MPETVAQHVEHHMEFRALHDMRRRYGSWNDIPTQLTTQLSATELRHLNAQRHAERRGAEIVAEKKPAAGVELKPLSFDERSANALRPATFDQMVGQERLKTLMKRIVGNARVTGRPLDHMLVVGASGTGKTTFAQVVAHELGRRVFQVKAPVEYGVFEWLAENGLDGDVLVIDEIHQMVHGDRRGITQAADPESLFHVMEDRRLPLAGEMIKFPAVTFIGATTDSGLLPEALINRFPLKLTLDPYTGGEMAKLAIANAHALSMAITQEGAEAFGRAARRTPRVLNSYMRNALALVGEYDGNGAGELNTLVAREVVEVLNGTTPDGLDLDMQRMLKVLYRSRRENAKGEVTYQASVNTIATALGHGRDTKAVALFVEPWLLQAGLVCVGARGRELTETGVKRAKEMETWAR